MPRVGNRHGHDQLLRFLDGRYQSLSRKHREAAPTGGTIPIGGGDWMDTFFRMEALRGCIGALRRDKTLAEAVEEGKTVAVIAVQIWNRRREYQVHRCEDTADDYLDSVVRSFYSCKRDQ